MHTKKSFFASVFLLFTVLVSSVSFGLAVVPDEGMYTPDQIARLPLLRRGLKIKPLDIYNPNGVSLADAIVRVNIGAGGGFGTGEFVSPDGLILTNHHVAFDALVEASTPASDYGKNGYRASSRADELPAKDYSIMLTNRVENVTSRILGGTENMTAAEREQAVKTKIADLEKQEQTRARQGATVRVQAVTSGYFYYLYETQMIRDVRVVYAPPRDIGFFGGDPDNFEWSRHTGDFTFLRAYVAPDGTSAAYSSANVPFKPKKFLTVSLGGVREDEFVFVMGYPGGTTRYRESQSIDYAQRVNFPFLERYLRAWSNALEMVGETDEAKRIKLQSEISSLNNSMKVYEGGQVSLRRGDTVAQRRAEEARFTAWVNANPARRAKYGEVLNNFSTAYVDFNRTAARDRVLRTFPNAGSTPVFKQVFDAIQAVAQGKALTPEKRAEIEAAFKTREPILEREMIKFFLKEIADLPNEQKFQAAETLFNRFQGKARRSAEETFAETISENKDFDTAPEVVNLYGMSLADLTKKYPNIVEFMQALAREQTGYQSLIGKFNPEANRLRVLFLQGMSEMRGQTPYPDANATLRFTFGNVKGYSPREAVRYTPFTTLKGVIEKDSGEFPFIVPQRLKDLQRTRDFGRYGAGDSVPVNFLATTDIIGGNSGSPILNGFGEQVGVVFDGNYEGLGNDLFFSGDYGRTIAVDIRYVLFVTEKFGNAGWILNEMRIKGGRGVGARTAVR